MKIADGMCPVCHGRRYNHKVFELREFCDNCKGHGDVYWIDEVVKRNPVMQVKYESAHLNIVKLIGLIKAEGRKLGKNINVILHDDEFDNEIRIHSRPDKRSKFYQDAMLRRIQEDAEAKFMYFNPENNDEEGI